MALNDVKEYLKKYNADDSSALYVNNSGLILGR